MPKGKVTQITPRKNTSLNQSALKALVTSNERCQSKSTQSQSQAPQNLKNNKYQTRKGVNKKGYNKRNTRYMKNSKISE